MICLERARSVLPIDWYMSAATLGTSDRKFLDVFETLQTLVATDELEEQTNVLTTSNVFFAHRASTLASRYIYINNNPVILIFCSIL